MKTSATGRAFIEAFEGKILHTYDDGTGVLTIGYGHTDAAGPPPVRRGQVITEAQADAILSVDLGKVERNVERCISAVMTQAQFDALVSFDFNTGDLAKSSIDDKINAGNLSAAMATLLQYDNAGGRQVAGLTRRRNAEKLMFTGMIKQAMLLAQAHTPTPDNPMPQAPHKPTTPPPPLPPQPTLIQRIIAFLASILRRH